MSAGLYTTPRTVADINECIFYHTVEIPGYGVVEGDWDLRHDPSRYLGMVNFKGKRVLEIGTASGFLCFHMERQGAEVVAYDLSEDIEPDLVPYSGHDYRQYMREIKPDWRKLTNGYWLCHKAYGSSAKVVYGTVYSIPEEIGLVDISVFGDVLLHLRDPFLALQNALRLTRETAIVIQPIYGYRTLRYKALSILERLLGLRGRLLLAASRLEQRVLPRSTMAFLPNYRTGLPEIGWWDLTPGLCKSMLQVLGFDRVEVNYHVQVNKGASPYRTFVPHYTVVGTRTRGIP